MSIEIKDIIDNKYQKSYWIHRTSISPLFINYNSSNNKQPVLLSKKQYDNLEDSANIFQLPADFWQDTERKEKSQDIEYLQANGITREMFLQKLQANYMEQVQDYFNNGLYTQRLDITTTATEITDEEGNTTEIQLEKTIKKANFGFVAGEDELSVLSNRAKLNVLFVLEIPKNCLESDDLQKLFEQTSKVLEKDTTYFGIQVLDKVIPSQYIKCAIISSGNSFQVISNPRYDKEYHIQDGIYDEAKLDDAIKQLSNSNFDYSKILAMIKKVNNNFKYNNSYLSYKNRTDKILEIISRNYDMDDRNAELHDKLLLAQEQTRKSTRTPLETASEDLSNVDINSMKDEEIVELISRLLSAGTVSMKNNMDNTNLYFNELTAYRKGLESIDDSMLRRIINSPRYNDIVGNVRTRKKLIEMLDAETTINAGLIEERLLAITKGLAVEDDLSTRERTNNNRTYLIKKALASSDMNTAVKIINYINEKDVSNLTIENCNDIVNSFNKDPKHSGDIEPR